LLLVGSVFIILQAEEKLRTLHEKKCKQLKRMDERSADAYKIDSTRSLIWSLSTKMRISIEVIDRISITINKLRDEEFLQQINKLILGYVIIPTSQENMASYLKPFFIWLRFSGIANPLYRMSEVLFLMISMFDAFICGD
jgi:predicted DNA repair protein MutK